MKQAHEVSSEATGIAKLASFSLARPVTISMMFLSLVTFGLISSRLLPLESWPEIKLPFLIVVVPYDAGTPQEVERNITRPVEEVLATIGDVVQMNSNSTTNSSTVFMLFNLDVDIDEKIMLVNEQLDLIRGDLPSDVRQIFVRKEEPGNESMMNIRLIGERNLEGAYDVLNQYLVKPVQRIPGVARVELEGIEPLEISIKLDNQRMKRYGVGFNELQSKLSNLNFSIRSGNMITDNEVIRITPKSQANDIDAYKNLVLNDRNVRLKDIATIELVNGERDYARHLNKKYSVGLEIFKESTANLVEVGEEVLNTIEAISQSKQMSGIEMVFLDNQAEGVTNSLRDVITAGITGSILSLFVLYVFLRNLPMTLIISMSIPISIIITLGVLYFTGISLNNLSLMGLMLAVGMLVDNSVVITESVYTQQKLDPENPRDALIKGVKLVIKPVIAGTLTTICVFLPVIVGDGNLLAIFLTHVAVAIIASLVISLMLSISVVPMAISLFVKKQHSKTGGLELRLLQRLGRIKKRYKFVGLVLFYGLAYKLSQQLNMPAENFTVFAYVSLFFLFSLFLVKNYQRMLTFFMRHRWLTFGSALSLILVCLGFYFSMKQDDGTGQSVSRSFWMPYHVNGNYTLDRMKKDVDRVEDYLYANKERLEIDSVYTYYNENGNATSMITLIDEADATKTVAQVKQEILADMPDITVGKPSFQWRSNLGSQGIKLYLQGESAQFMRDELLDEVMFILRNVENVTNVQVEQRNNREELQVNVNRERALNLGLNPTQVAQSVSIAMRGMNLREYVSEQGEIPVKMRFYQKGEFEIEQLRNLPIKNADGVSVPLNNVAEIVTTSSPQRLFRLGRQNSIQIDLDVADDSNVKEVREKITQALAQVNMPTGYSWTFNLEGGGANISLVDLVMPFFIALLIIFMVMAAMFESLLFPICVYTTILFSILGIFLFFAITGTTFNIMAGIGAMILVGVVVNNGIVLIDHINNLRKEGMSRFDAVVQGGLDRIRPVLMTVSTTVVGLLPLSVSVSAVGGGNGPSYFPMARAIIGGLTFSTIISLILLPCIYCWLDDLRLWGQERFRRIKQKRLASLQQT
ncbi:efflux RND transporter permease subunit [Marinicella sp. S1101]|uniref:efflux RND transporter permease subunit n=1 Tax=Marinicella marina TaxID=2996016 RepID=UPI002260F346|nr:efflux RND transporter permease subunit [Marinicella marina]MCX7554474.1 efflux RND transporter permease subunit [Marinicella marina]MDJ1140625.1 efflux RND transporter permease subunit [Marinicella marina]